MSLDRTAHQGAILLGLAWHAYVGGIFLTDLTYDDQPIRPAKPLVVSPGLASDLCFKLDGYSYSGRKNESAYAVFQVAPASTPAGTRAYFTRRFKSLDDPDAPGEGFKVTYCVKIEAPRPLGDYALSYSHVLMFPSDYPDFDTLSLGRFAAKHMKRYPSAYQTTIAKLRVTSAAPPVASADEPVTYLRLNGQPPSLNTRIEGGLDKPPAVFSWFVRPARKNMEHRYRLFPVEDWSPWSPDTVTAYYFIAPAALQFQVMSRAPSPSGGWVEGGQARYQFLLEQPLVAKPLAKGGPPGLTHAAPVELKNLYVKSRALLIGVTKYTDPKFGALPYTGNDLMAMDRSLRALGFEVTTRSGPLTRDRVAQTVDSFVRASDRKERLVLYFSTHGFADPADPAKAYLATSDCRPAQPSTCLGLQELDGLLRPVLNSDKKPILHLLVLVDACSAGLGVIDKAGQFTESAVAVRPGAHMMTAGLANQEAEQDPGLTTPMSTFTYYLADGLSGKADYTGDGVVSLSELLVYVRFNVAKRTQGRQTPMVGRMAGGGEMVFGTPAGATVGTAP